jgi:hypothetical protein
VTGTEEKLDIEAEEKFIKRVESLIDPDEVGDLTFLQRLKRLLPKTVFKKILFRTSKRFPYIGFVIEPYSLFLFFRLKDFEKARALLPQRYELVKSRITADDEPGYFHGMGILNTRGSTFGGTRLESYLIARDKETGLVSWIFLDILSNTLIALPRDGVADRNSSGAMFTTSSKGEIFIDIAEDESKRRLHLRGSIRRGEKKALDKPLWIGGNTSIAYTERLSGGAEEPFAVIFDPAEVDTALEIPIEDIDLRENTLIPGLAEAKLAKVLCFPFAQHYIADSPGCRTYVRDEEHMIALYKEIAGRPEMKTFSTKAIKKLLIAGVALSVAWTLGLTIALILSLVF